MFQPNDYLIKLKGKDYLEVKWRLVWFRDQYPHGSIQTELLHMDLDKGIAIFKATVADGQGGTGVGHGSESSKDFGDYIEKAETKSIGRAMATMGFGTQFAPELEEGEGIVDSPVERAAMGNTTATSNYPPHNGKALPASTQREYGVLQPVNGKNGQHPHSARLNELYARAKAGGLAETPAKFIDWVGSLFPDRTVSRPADISLEMIEYMEAQVSHEQEATHV